MAAALSNLTLAADQRKDRVANRIAEIKGERSHCIQFREFLIFSNSQSYFGNLSAMSAFQDQSNSLMNCANSKVTMT